MIPKRAVFLQSIFFASLGILFLYLSFRKTNFTNLWQVFQMGNYWVVLPVFLVSITVYISRVKRWKLLYKASQIDAPQSYLLASLASGYLVNFAVPRLGEISRALILKRSLNYPVNISLSTIVFERLADVLCLAIILFVAFFLEFIYAGSLLNQFTNGINVFSWQKLGAILVLLLGLYLGYKRLKTKHNQISNWITELVDNLIKLLRMPNFGWFIFHTAIIWLGFFLMTYLWFFMFTESAKLSIYQAYLVMVLGVVARTLPIQAGSAGAYHYIVSKALVLLGVSVSIGNALAIVIHGFQTILTLLFGLLAYIWLLKKRTSNRQDV
ncbi:MAG: lysylphosphatidylglycerol synthase transmembrane domain-containing protein [bacterium]|nr:lysylphosphatidylglycerol synthase transmembrane domain-containing protein [bacterium]